MSKKRLILAGVASGVAGLLAFDASAQQAAAPATPDNGELQRVTVTAQKRKEDINAVPLSVSVMSGEQLAADQVAGVTDLTRNIPNISFSTQGGSGLANVEIRGVSSQAGSATVAIYLDDVSLMTRNLYSQGTAEPHFFDLDHVEVLRGPQGTLYGASSLGGTLKFVSRQPDPKSFGGSASLSLSNTDHGGTNYGAEGVVNVPLVKNAVALRVGVQTGHDSGYIDQVSPDTLQVIKKGINSTRWSVAKLALKAELAPGWSITPAIFAQQDKADDIDATYLTVGSYQNNAGTPLAMFQTSKIVREPGSDRLTIPSVTLNGDVGVGDLTAVLSGYKRRFKRTQDGTYINGVGFAVADPDLAAVVNTLPSLVNLDNRIDQTSLELRLTSRDYDPSVSPLTWIGGVYLTRAKTQVFDNEPIVGINAAFAAAGKDINDPAELDGSFPGAFTNDSSYYSARHYVDKQSSVFGEITYHVDPKVSFTGGLRFMSASQHFTREGNYYWAGGPSTALIDTAAHAITPRAAMNYELDKQTTLFANVAKGFRLGGANRPIPSPDVNVKVKDDLASLGLSSAPATFKPDSLMNYEIGAKSRLFGNKVSLNVSAFLIDWKNIQQDIILPTAGYDFEDNGGRATIYGLEAELKARVSENLSLHSAAGVTHARFAVDVPKLGNFPDGYNNFPPGYLHVHSGDTLPGVPAANASAGFDYHWALSGATNAFVRGNAQWTGKSRGSLVADNPDYRRVAYTTVDGSFGFNVDRWEVTVFGKNLGNTRDLLQQPQIQGVNEAYYLRPRTIGISVSADLF